MTKTIDIWADGSSHNNGEKKGLGGYGTVMMFGSFPSKDDKAIFTEYCPKNKRMEFYEGFPDGVTNQQMELMAVIRGLKRITNSKYKVRVFSDSAYLINCMKEKWWAKWRTNGWKNSKKQAVENRNLWEELLQVIEDNWLQIEWIKVKGHSGIFFNELADSLAEQGRKEAEKDRPAPQKEEEPISYSLKTKSNEELWNTWRFLADRIRIAPAIIQNDCIVTEDQINESYAHIASLAVEMIALNNKTNEYLLNESERV